MMWSNTESMTRSTSAADSSVCSETAVISCDLVIFFRTPLVSIVIPLPGLFLILTIRLKNVYYKTFFEKHRIFFNILFFL